MLKKLDDFNKQRTEAHIKAREHPKLNGLACPECGKELSDTDSTILTSDPPKRNVNCENCGFLGYRIA